MPVHTVQRFARNTVGRDVAVGDIHGCIDKLYAALDAAGFDRSRDRLFACGDLVDRGPDSLRVDELLAQPWFFSVQGNHEDMAIRFPRGNMMVDNYFAHGAAWNIANVPAERQRYADLLDTLPFAIEVETEFGIVGIVHANVDGYDWGEFAVDLHRPGGRGNVTRDIAQWDRTRYDAGDCGVVDGVRAVMVGHHPTRARRILGNVHHIDTRGWKPDGFFTFIDLATLSDLVPIERTLDWSEA